MQATIAEAAKILRLSERTIRRRVQTGELKGKQVSSVGGFAWIIDLPDAATQGSHQPGQLDSVSNGEIAAMKALVARLEAQVSAQQEQLTIKDKQIEQILTAKDRQIDQLITAKDKQIEQLHVLLQQAQATLPAPKGGHSWWRFWTRA